jgi:hypothetical protein
MGSPIRATRMSEPTLKTRRALATIAPTHARWVTSRKTANSAEFTAFAGCVQL